MGARSERTPLRLSGRPAAPGLAAGPLVRLAESPRAARRAGTSEEERAALASALDAAGVELAALAGSAGDPEAEGILAFQLAFLDDKALTAPVSAGIDRGEAADEAWRAALDGEIASYDASADSYFRGRAADLRDLRDRVLRHLAGEAEQPLPAGAIVAAEDMPPSRFLATDWRDGGLVLRRGSATSHVAILARARGVPMIVGVSAGRLDNGRAALLDADAGELILDPDPETRRTFEARQAEQARCRAEEAAFLHRPAVTADGQRVRVMINVAAAAELDSLDPAHSDGIGLVRTEFLFYGRDRLPDEEEQLAEYRRILDWAQGRPVTIRTLDAGGDKPIPGLTCPGESNPFLGVRGVRLSLRRPDVFRVQLRALSRAATAGNLKVMVPMVTVADELARCRALLSEAFAALRREGREAALPPLGMMVEVPAAALAIEDFDADFYSIGSNDLIQYVAAASRDESELVDLTTPSRALFGLIERVVQHARRMGREASLCGDLAADPRHVPVLLDSGLRVLSVAPAALPAVKAAAARYRGRA